MSVRRVWTGVEEEAGATFSVDLFVVLLAHVVELSLRLFGLQTPQEVLQDGHAVREGRPEFRVHLGGGGGGEEGR